MTKLSYGLFYENMRTPTTENSQKRPLSPKQERAALRRRTETSIREANKVLNRCHSMIEQTVMRALSSNHLTAHPCSQATLSWIIEEFLEDEGYEEYSLACLGNHDRTGRLCFVAFYDKMGAKKAFLFEFDAVAMPTESLIYMVSQGHVLDVHLDDYPVSDTNHDLEIYRDRIFRARNQIDFVNSNNLAYDYVKTKLFFSDDLGRLRLVRDMQSQGFCLVCKTNTEARGFHVTRNNVAHSYKLLDIMERCSEACGYGDLFHKTMVEFKHSQGSPKLERLQAPLCREPVRTPEEIASDLIKLMKEAVSPVIVPNTRDMQSQAGIFERLSSTVKQTRETLAGKPKEFVGATVKALATSIKTEFSDLFASIGHDWMLWLRHCIEAFALEIVPVVILWFGIYKTLSSYYGLAKLAAGYGTDTLPNLVKEMGIGFFTMKLGGDLVKAGSLFREATNKGASMKESLRLMVNGLYKTEKANFVTLAISVSEHLIAWCRIFYEMNGLSEDSVDEPSTAKVVEMDRVFVSQSGQPTFAVPEFDLESVKGLVGSVFGLVSISTLGFSPSAKAFKDFLVLIGSVPRATEGIMKLWEYLHETFQKIVGFVKRLALKDDRVHHAAIGIPSIDIWCEQILTVNHQAMTNTLDITTDNFIRVCNLQIMGFQFCANPAKYGDSMRIRSVLNEYMRVLRELLVPFKNANIYGVKPRMEPVTIYLAGAPGVGKSVIVIPLMLAILRRVLKPEQFAELRQNYNNFIYCRQTEHEFWDRYFGQMVTIFDDYLQRRDTEQATASEAMELIRISSMFPNVLHMAALEQKGTTVFNSKIIVCTSNFTTINSVVSIQSKEALQRRFTHTYELVPKIDYCTPATKDLQPAMRRLDRNLFGSEIQLDIHEFREMKWEGESAYPTGVSLNFQDVVDEVARAFAERVMAHEKFEIKNQEVINGCMDRDKDLEAKLRLEMSIRDAVNSEVFVTDIVDDEDPDLEEKDISEADLDSDSESEDDVDSLLNEIPALDIEPELPRLPRSAYFYELKPSQVIYLYFTILGGKFVNLFDKAKNGCQKSLRKIEKVVGEYIATDAGRNRLISKAFSAPLFAILVDVSKLQFLKQKLQYYKKQIELGAQKAWSSPLIQGLVALGSAAGFGFTAFMLYRRLNPKLGSQSGEARRNRPRREIVKASRLQRTLRNNVPSNWVSQSGVDVNAMSLAKRLAKKNCYRISIEGFDTPIGHGLFVKGRILMTFGHIRQFLYNYIDDELLSEDDVLVLSNKNYKHQLKVHEFLRLDHWDAIEKDIVFIEMPRNVHSHPDITRHFITDSLLKNPVDWTVGLGGWNEDYVFHDSFAFGKLKKDTVHHGAGEEFYVKGVIGYDIPTNGGDCGKILILHNRSTQGKIIGLHVCGNGTRGESSIVTRELIESCLTNFEGESLICPPVVDEKVVDTVVADLGQGIGPVMKSQINSICRKSKIIPSRLYEAWGPATTAPAILDYIYENGRKIDPMFDNLKRYCKNSVPIEPDLIKAVTANISSFYFNMTNLDRDHKDILTFEEVVEGIPGAKYHDPIDRKSSAGYPWVLEKPNGYPGKTFWLGSGEEPVPYDSPQTRKLRASVEGIIADAKRGVRREHIFNDFPKDERRSLAKIAQRKTRSISGCPMDLAIAMKMYFHAFSVFIMKNRVHNRCAVGINARSEEWTGLVNKLKEHLATFAGDHAGFDTDMVAAWLWAVLDIMNNWFNDSDEDKLVRTVLWSSVVNSFHIYEGVIYLWGMSNPSGNILTVILNCLVNEMYVQSGYAILHPQGIIALPNFYKDVVNITYGDDHITSVSLEASVWFNQVTLARALKTLGLTYTDENKQEPTVPFRKLEELSFLKRGFRYERDLRQWIAPLSLDTIVEMPYWTKEGMGSEEITRTNAQEALIELSLHGEAKFDKISKEIVNACRSRLNWSPERYTYEACINFAMTHEVIY